MNSAPDKDVARVVAGMSEAMRHTMSGPIRHSYGDTMARVGRKATIVALNNRGLLSDIRFTPLGLKVRAALNEDKEYGGAACA